MRRNQEARRVTWQMLGLGIAVFLLTASPAVADGPPPGPKVKASPEAAPKAGKTEAPVKPAPRKEAVPAKPDVEKKAKKNATTPLRPSPRKIRIRAKDVYFGQYRAFRNPAVLNTQAVFNAISYYQKVKEDGLTKKTGRYWILMQKSNRIFYKALRRLASGQGYDLIGARNSILIDGANPVDVTASLVAIIPSITLD